MFKNALSIISVLIILLLSSVIPAYADLYAYVEIEPDDSSPQIVIEQSGGFDTGEMTIEDQYVNREDVTIYSWLDNETPNATNNNMQMQNNGFKFMTTQSVHPSTDSSPASNWNVFAQKYANEKEAKEAAMAGLLSGFRSFKTDIDLSSYGLGVQRKGYQDSTPSGDNIMMELLYDLLSESLREPGCNGEETIPDIFYIDSTSATFRCQLTFKLDDDSNEAGLGTWQIKLVSLSPKYIDPKRSPCSAEKAKEYSIRFENKVNEIVANANDVIRNNEPLEFGTNFGRIHYVHDYLIANNYYDHDSDTWTTGSYDSPWSAYSAIISGRTVCRGYALATQYILEKMGIKSYYVNQDLWYLPNSNDLTNTYTSGCKWASAHAWNRVLLNNKWYNLDVTWDDESGSNGIMKYFLKSDSYWINAAGGPNAAKFHTKWTQLGDAGTDTRYDNKIAGSVIVKTPIDDSGIASNPGSKINVVVTLPNNAVFSGVAIKGVKAAITDGLYNWHSLEEGIDYYIEYENNYNAGIATARIYGMNAYSGVREYTFEIKKRPLTEDYFYELHGCVYEAGATVEPRVHSSFGGVMESVDVSFTNNRHVGTGWATITARPNSNYTGSVVIPFPIDKSDISYWYNEDYQVPDQYYDGSAKRPVVSKSHSVGYYTRGRWPEKIYEYDILERAFLVEGRDYTVTYYNNVAAGQATAVITGINGCKGQVTKTFNIAQAPIKPTQISAIKLRDKVYDGKPYKITRININGFGLELGRDFTAAYTNEVNAGTGTVQFVFKGNYTGTVTSTFQILKAPNTLGASGYTTSIKASSVKKKAKVLKKVHTFSPKGKITYTKASGSKRLSINKNTGKVAVAKGTSAGTYSMKVKVHAAGNSNYWNSTRTVTVKVKVTR